MCIALQLWWGWQLLGPEFNEWVAPEVAHVQQVPVPVQVEQEDLNMDLNRTGTFCNTEV